jgi:hypothetical protein
MALWFAIKRLREIGVASPRRQYAKNFAPSSAFLSKRDRDSRTVIRLDDYMARDAASF